MTREQIMALQCFVTEYGDRSQEDMAIEECSELIQAILKYRRKPSIETVMNIVEEMADVEIMLTQLKMIFHCSSEVDDMIARKINRQWERMMINE